MNESTCSVIFHQKVLKFPNYTRSRCLWKVAHSCIPANNVSDYGDTHYQSPVLNCLLDLERQLAVLATG